MALRRLRPKPNVEFGVWNLECAVVFREEGGGVCILLLFQDIELICVTGDGTHMVNYLVLGRYAPLFRIERQLDTRRLPSGMYFVRMRAGDRMESERFVVVR